MRIRWIFTTLAFLTLFIVQAAPAQAATFDVRDYGATGNGTTNDTAAINKAITAANNAGGGTVRFPSGTYRSANTIHLKSNITIQLDAGSTILGSPNDTYDAAEPNPNDEYQDYGHSHFHNAMLYGDQLTNLAFTGTGTIDGGDNLITGNPKAGEADKIISLTRCTGLTIDGIKLRQGGHFAILTNGCDNISSNNLRVETAGDRDGWNVINAKNVTVTNANIAANDDALVFKSDWALGQTIDNGHVRVSDSKLSAGCCNALMFGSETCGDFTDYVFDRITITGAGKSGLGLVSMDGSKISDVHYRDITMSGTRGHIMQKIGTRRRCGDSPGIGGISNITYQNVTGSYDGAAGTAYSSTLWGESASANRIRQHHLRQREPHRARRQRHDGDRGAEQRSDQLQPEQHRHPAGVRVVSAPRRRSHLHQQLGPVRQERRPPGGDRQRQRGGQVHRAHGATQYEQSLRCRLPDGQRVLRDRPEHHRWSVADQRHRFDRQLYAGRNPAGGGERHLPGDDRQRPHGLLRHRLLQHHQRSRRRCGVDCQRADRGHLHTWHPACQRNNDQPSDECDGQRNRRRSPGLQQHRGLDDLADRARHGDPAGGGQHRSADRDHGRRRTERRLPREAAVKAVAALAALATVAGTLTLTAAPAVALENGLARTPPMGFNNWNSTKCTNTFNEAMIKSIADLFVSKGLKAVGYQYVNIDDCWALPQRNAQGNLVPDPARFPNGIKALADYVHGKGLKFGIYTSAGTKTCNTAGFPGGLGHEKQDASLFASWGVDYLKYDNCNNQGVDAQQRYTAMRDALRDTGRPITYSICEWGRTGPPRVWEWGKDVGNLWRTTGDISDNWSSMIGKAQANRVLAEFAGPGHWNDPDMLEVGNGGMTATEYRSHFSLWSIMSAPLLIGTDLRKASDDAFAILTNADVIAIDQDKLGRQASVVSSSGGLVVYGKTLSNGDRAVALSNETGSTATISTTAAALGLGGSSSYSLKDLWSKAVRSTSGAISASVPAHGTVLYRVSRAGTTTRYEAESGTYTSGSTVDKDHSGYSGTGFVNTPNGVGSYVQWTVNRDQAGPATLVFDHANGTTVNRSMDITVNGVPVARNLAFPGTGAWTLWRTNYTTANLVAGANVIRATATSSSGTPNLDYLEVATP